MDSEQLIKDLYVIKLITKKLQKKLLFIRNAATPNHPYPGFPGELDEILKKQKNSATIKNSSPYTAWINAGRPF